MDLDKLTNSEVETLLESIKQLKQKLFLDTNFSGRIKQTEEVLGIHNGIEYKLYLYRNPVQSDRYSIHLRFKENDQHLIRVDVNNGSHRNPDGLKIQQNHFHIYRYEENESRRDAYAYPLESEDSDLMTIFTALENFLEYTYIKQFS